jgi:hypothetical protein
MRIKKAKRARPLKETAIIGLLEVRSGNYSNAIQKGVAFAVIRDEVWEQLLTARSGTGVMSPEDQIQKNREGSDHQYHCPYLSYVCIF